MSAYERFYFQYQTEALPHGESVQSFCLRNKVPYNIFSKWYKDTRKRIVEVQVDNRPVAIPPSQAPSPSTAQPKPVEKRSAEAPSSTGVRIWLELRMSNGLHLSRKNLSYQELVDMIEKLEVLC